MLSGFFLIKNCGPVARPPNNELNRTGLEPVSALNFLLCDITRKYTFLLFQTQVHDCFLLLPNRKDSEG